jgi:hypothetical protein
MPKGKPKALVRFINENRMKAYVENIDHYLIVCYNVITKIFFFLKVQMQMPYK